MLFLEKVTNYTHKHLPKQCHLVNRIPDIKLSATFDRMWQTVSPSSKVKKRKKQAMITLQSMAKYRVSSEYKLPMFDISFVFVYVDSVFSHNFLSLLFTFPFLMNVITLFQNIFIEALKYKRHSSPSLYSCLFIWK